MLSQGFLNHMSKKRSGKIINFSTVLADNPLPTLHAYSSSKAALIVLTKSIALQYASLGIQANVIAPGYIENPKHAEYFETEHGQNFATRFMPTGIVGPEDAINGTVLFLFSDLSNHMTGQVLKVDGGYSIW